VKQNLLSTLAIEEKRKQLKEQQAKVEELVRVSTHEDSERVKLENAIQKEEQKEHAWRKKRQQKYDTYEAKVKERQANRVEFIKELERAEERQLQLKQQEEDEERVLLNRLQHSLLTSQTTTTSPTSFSSQASVSSELEALVKKMEEERLLLEKERQKVFDEQKRVQQEKEELRVAHEQRELELAKVLFMLIAR